MADLALLRKEDIEAMTAPLSNVNSNKRSGNLNENSNEKINENPNEKTNEGLNGNRDENSDEGRNEKLIRIAPGKDGGTNMMFIGAPDVFEVNYYGESFKKHKEEAEKKNLVCEIHESFFAAADMDEPEDLKDILIFENGPIHEFISMILNRNKTTQVD
ncbi:Phosphoenolpyruvate guanylyltransferase [Methanimicrococcus sp. At1]|uniref:Phosphoenolpyruvate guanylyltransferase n=1 Tax=Methanimicrococcus hacksteinii TaxID=3028293 RepID=A0ABU3VMD3_9EURY|nr:hypothetical protein [Methanimicrococcus sp. At1]MDV0444562.1 Phosphoenolpyruvate guanylyltransferase [Methanimicrococcus sp. At1]